VAAKWLAYSLICLALWGLWGFLLKLASKGLDWRTVYFLSTVASFSLAVAVVLASGGVRVGEAPRALVAAALAAGVAGGGGYVAFMKALESGKASIVIPLTAAYPAITVVLALVFLGEKLSAMQVAGIVLVILACILLSIK